MIKGENANKMKLNGIREAEFHVIKNRMMYRLTAIINTFVFIKNN
jgi:hypothetical protein